MRTGLQKLIASWPILVALISGASGSYAWVQSQIDKRISAAIQIHDRETLTAAHPSHQIRFQVLEDYWKSHQKEHDKMCDRVTKSEQEHYELYWFAVGDKAALTERDPRKRAASAESAREHFRTYIRDGEGLREAYRHALEAYLVR